MGDASPDRLTKPVGAVFVSYASEDAAAAERIAASLRSAGMQVWFDRSELRGGDEWAAAIRSQIKECRLFIAVISANAHRRVEGFFRLEWNLAIDRSHRMAPGQAFLLPVVIDDTRRSDDRIPDRFRELQWSRLPDGQAPPGFVEHVLRLLTPDVFHPSTPALPSAEAALTSKQPSPISRRPRFGLLAIWAVAAIAVAGYIVLKPRIPSAPVPTLPPPVPSAAVFNPPPRSIAVLPFVNMSGDAKQEYFSDGLTEELLNSLARINELQVAARTSAFSFKNTNTDIPTVARKLNVANVLEGSVRRSTQTVRVTAQLINAVTGYHLWSRTYDRKLGDILVLQTDIANAVAVALKVTLVGDVAAKVELGGTRNPDAFSAYLRALRDYSANHEEKDLKTAIAEYTEAVRLDPSYALAFAARSLAHSEYAGQYAAGAAIRKSFDKAAADARTAITLAPDLAEGHLALSQFFDLGALDVSSAMDEAERALDLAPGNALVLRRYAPLAGEAGRTGAAMAAARRAIALDPLNSNSFEMLGRILYLFAHQYDEAIVVLRRASAVDPDNIIPHVYLGLAYYALGDLPNARASCEIKPDYWESQVCLAVTYAKLGRRTDAEAMLVKLRASFGDDVSYQYAQIYAQWGDTSKALEWLEKAQQLRDPGLSNLRGDPLMDPLRGDPRFQRLEQALSPPPKT